MIPKSGDPITYQGPAGYLCQGTVWAPAHLIADAPAPLKAKTWLWVRAVDGFDLVTRDGPGRPWRYRRPGPWVLTDDIPLAHRRRRAQEHTPMELFGAHA